ncbi:hypothetical protein ACQ4PT_045424 [Festuca glaucescens]
MAAAGDGTRRKTACVTGGNGYIASALVKMLLEKGYAVKTTVRNPDDMEKNSHLKDLQALGPLEVFRADLQEEGSFDDAVAGCDYAFLVAAPVNLKAENPEKDMVEPAVGGTLNVMRSCVRAGTVKRVVLTSSVASVSARPLLQGDGPVVVVGAAPAVQVHTSVPDVLSPLSGDEAKIRMLQHIERASGSSSLVHVDDLCRAEVFLAEEEAALGRYICCSLSTTAAELARFLSVKYPQYKVRTDRFSVSPEKPRVCMSSAKLVAEGFEYKYKTLDEIYDDVVEYGRALGILPY